MLNFCNLKKKKKKNWAIFFHKAGKLWQTLFFSKIIFTKCRKITFKKNPLAQKKMENLKWFVNTKSYEQVRYLIQALHTNPKPRVEVKRFEGKAQLWMTMASALRIILLLLGPAPHKDRDYCIRSNFWKFYLIRTGFTLGELVSLVKVFRLFRLKQTFWVFRVWTQ